MTPRCILGWKQPKATRMWTNDLSECRVGHHMQGMSNSCGLAPVLWPCTSDTGVPFPIAGCWDDHEDISQEQRKVPPWIHSAAAKAKATQLCSCTVGTMGHLGSSTMTWLVRIFWLPASLLAQLFPHLQACLRWPFLLIYACRDDTLHPVWVHRQRKAWAPLPWRALLFRESLTLWKPLPQIRCCSLTIGNDRSRTKNRHVHDLLLGKEESRHRLKDSEEPGASAAIQSLALPNDIEHALERARPGPVLLAVQKQIEYREPCFAWVHLLLQ